MQNDSGFLDWKNEITKQLEAEPNGVSKGDAFVQRVLRYRYQLSEDDAVNATDMAGSGDYGIDGLIIEPAEDGNPPRGIIVQGKYGTAGLQASPLTEFRKFCRGLEQTSNEEQTSDALVQCASILNSGGTLLYIIATVDPLSAAQVGELQDARAIANQRYGPRVALEGISLRDLYEEIGGQQSVSSSVFLTCKGVSAEPETFIGAATLVDVYEMLREYASLHNGSLDSIYDRNVRKWLKIKARSVNKGINDTLQHDPERFIAYNNGISMVCRNFEISDGRLCIDSPQIVNGCQTTRTLYVFMENHFAGVQSQLEDMAQAQRYRKGLLAFKLIAVENFDTDFVRDITRFANKQNAVRGRDFLTLEKEFHRLKSVLLEKGYYLEVQTGEFNVLPKNEKQKFREERLVNAFDALRFYGAAILRKPHTAFGRSGEFTPGGNEFDEAMKGLTEQDLLVPWLMSRHAAERGYSIGSKKNSTRNDYRNQTRYFYLYMLFRVASHVILDSPHVDRLTRLEFYDKLLKLRISHLNNSKEETAFKAMMDMADNLVATYMNLAHHHGWFQDRNAFLKSQDLLKEERILLASGELEVKKPELKAKAQAVLSN